MSVSFKDVLVNDKPSKADQLNKVSELDQGIVKFSIQSPSVLLASEPGPITDRVVDWLMVTLGDKSCADLWKLSVISAACAHFYFTWEQAIEVWRALADPGERCSSQLVILNMTSIHHFHHHHRATH